MNKLSFILIFLALSLCMQAQKIAFDAKYIKVGVVTNISLPQIENNANIRNLGQINYQNIYEKKVDGNIIADKLNQEKVGKIVLDRLLKRDSRGRLNMNSLYDEALNNTTLQETEVAMQDISAETKDVLKKEISYQLLKNNYIIIIQEIPKKKDPQKSKWYWQAFHVDIDDRIIQQVFLNWENPAIYDEINVPVSFVGEGRYYTDSFMFDLGKKVPAFAIRGSVFSRHPFLAYTTAQQGVKKGDRFFIYRFKENRKGEIYSKKVCTARATEVTSKHTRLYTVSGKYASKKRGDVAVQKDRHNTSLSFMGQYSAGNDSRIGGRLLFDYMTHFSKRGIAQYVLVGLDYNRYKKEPEGVWWNENGQVAQPALNDVNFSLGYGLGFNLLGRMEIMPYAMAGYQRTFLTGRESLIYWDSNSDDWATLDFTDSKTGKKHYGYDVFIAHAGVRLSVNIWYPLQLMIAADYNYTTEDNRFKPITNRHEMNRINLYAGFRLHF